MSTLRSAAALALAACLLTGCSTGTGSGDGGSAAGGDYQIWDPYPQFDDSSDWVKLLNKCGTDAGVTVKRTGYDTTDLTNKALLAAQQGN
jgi:multiple sugar transport system substrate-binding protein